MATFKFIPWTRLCLFILIKGPAQARETHDEEPVCTSRFDYEYKMLYKTVMLEIEQNKIKELMRQMNELQKTLEDESRKYREKTERVERRLTEIEAGSHYGGTGNTYVHWGRTDCSGNGTEMVYKGFAGGGHYNNKGAANNYLCLPEEPVWGTYEDTEQVAGTVWGAEYELYGRNMEKFFGKDVLNNNDVPCCVCRTQRASVIMIPGRNICYDGWTLEYGGYLTSGHDTHYGSEFVCLDGAPEIIKGGIADNNGKLFYFVESRCGSLPCPPYVNGRELTCAVCSK